MINFALTNISGLPLIAWGGMLTFFLMLFAASIPIARQKQFFNLPFSWHKRLAITALILSLIHGFLGLLIFLS